MLVICNDCREIQCWAPQGGLRLRDTACVACKATSLRKMTGAEDKARRAAFAAKLPARQADRKPAPESPTAEQLKLREVQALERIATALEDLNEREETRDMAKAMAPMPLHEHLTNLVKLCRIA